MRFIVNSSSYIAILSSLRIKVSVVNHATAIIIQNRCANRRKLLIASFCFFLFFFRRQNLIDRFSQMSHNVFENIYANYRNKTRRKKIYIFFFGEPILFNFLTSGSCLLVSCLSVPSMSRKDIRTWPRVVVKK